MNATTLVAAVFACPFLVLAAGLVRPRAAGPTAAALAASSFGAVLAAWVWGLPAATFAWIPTLGLSLHLGLDGLGALFALLTTGIGALVILFSIAYLPHEIEEERERTRFFVLITLFMASMVALVMSFDLYSLLISWDLTAITSYLLIATHRSDPEARSAARMALVITAGTAVLLVAAAVDLHVSSGTSWLPRILADDRARPVAAVLVAVAALAKSAQVPLHFWLPRAMVAPTPVSAYLHSAAMVAAGVFLLARLHPLLAAAWPTPTLLLWVGGASMLVGSLLALAKDDIKAVLAYSTVAQYGYVVWLLGLGGAEAASAAAFYVGAHGLAKSGLFLTAGAVTEAAGGERALSRLGGLGSRLPLLAAASGICAAALAALPLTLGFFRDELFFAAAVRHGTAATAGAVAAAALTLAYTSRFWGGIFLGGIRGTVHAPGRLLVVPIAVLAAGLVVGGLVPNGYTALAEAAGAVIHGAPAPVETAYHLDPRPTNLMALGAWALGALVLLAARAGWRPWELAARAGAVAGPERLYALATGALGSTSNWLHGIEVRDLRDRAAAVLVPGAVLIAGPLVLSPGTAVFETGSLAPDDLPLVAAVVVAALAAVAAARVRRHLPTVLALSMVSYSLALAFAFFGAPNVALVAVLVQTVLTLLMLAALSLFPPEALVAVARRDRPERSRRVLYTVVASGAAFALVWLALSWQAPPVTTYVYVTRAHEAHAKDVVTAILADFRGLDTLGEATVLAVAMLGIATLLRWSRKASP